MSFETDLEELKKEITPRKALQYAAGTFIAMGAAAAVVAVLKNPVSAAKGLTKWMMRLGIFVLGCKAGEVAETYFNKTVDDFAEQFNDIREEAVKYGDKSNE